jgi:hypothetical protein
MLTVLDEYTREALAVTLANKMGSSEVLEALYPLLLNAVNLNICVPIMAQSLHPNPSKTG